MKTAFTSMILLIVFVIAVNAQTTFHLENGDFFQASHYKITPDNVEVDGKSIKKSDILYFENGGNMYVINHKKGKKIKVRLNESPETSCSKGVFYAYRYYNSKLEIFDITAGNPSLASDENFRQCYKEKVRKIRANSTTTSVVCLCVAALALGLSLSAFTGH